MTEMGWLNRASWALLALLGGLLFLLNFAELRQNWRDGPLTVAAATRSMPEEDFANLWAAGLLARSGQLGTLYNPAKFQAFRAQRFGPSIHEEDWVYPPTVLLLGVPFSCLPLLPAFLLWDAGGWLVAFGLLRLARLPWPLILAGLAGPAAWRSLELGQYGVPAGAMVVAGVLLAPRHPLRAGVLLGLATLKPQQGVVMPFAWLAAGHWRAILAAAAVSGALALAVWPAWHWFGAGAAPAMRGLLNAKPPQDYINEGVSVFWMVRSCGAGLPAAYVAQAATAFGAILVTVYVWRIQNADPLARMAVTVCMSLLVIPYGFTSDMVAVSIAAGAVAAARNWRLDPRDVLAFLWAGYCPLVTWKTGIVFTPVIVAMIACRAWASLRAASAAPPSARDPLPAISLDRQNSTLT